MKWWEGIYLHYEQHVQGLFKTTSNQLLFGFLGPWISFEPIPEVERPRHVQILSKLFGWEQHVQIHILGQLGFFLGLEEQDLFG